MTFNVATLSAAYRPRANDAKVSRFAARLKQCQDCPKRKAHTCGLSGQLITVSARPADAHCPASRWPGDPPPIPAPQYPDPARNYGPQEPPRGEAPFAAIDKLAVITCFYNSENYARPRDNFFRFADGIDAAGLPLYVIELAFDDDEFNLPFEGKLTVRGTRARNLMWQKERLLNIVIEQLPAAVEGIAWIDADILFLNPAWPDALRESLARYQVVQMFEEAYNLLPGSFQLQKIRRSTAWHWVHDRDHYDDFRKTHPGFAWAGRASWIRRHGLQDDNITGGSDTLMVQGFTGQPLWLNRDLSKGWLEEIRRWAFPVDREIRAAFGYVPGTILHLWHGTRENRRYDDRWSWMTRVDFDPRTDLQKDANGLWAWSDAALACPRKRTMIEAIRALFPGRKEDENAA